MTLRLRYVAEVNPQTPAFDRLADAADVTFAPLETVWGDNRLDLTRRRPKSEVATGYVRFQEGDVLCPKVTPTFQAGRSALIESLATRVGAASTEIHVVRVREGAADARFVRYSLLTKPFLDEGVARFQGVAGLQRVPDEFVRDLPLPDIRPDRQRQIADYLDDQVARIDNIIAARKRQHELADDSYTAALVSWFSGKQAVPMRRYIREAVVGIVVQPARLYTELDDGVPALRGLNVNEGAIAEGDLVRITPTGHREHPRSQLGVGDIVVVRTGDAGAAAVVPERAVGWNCIDLVIVRASRLATPEYLELAINSARRGTTIEAASSGSIQQHFGVGALLDLPVPWRPMEEQLQVVAEMRREHASVREIRDRLLGSIDVLRELKRSLITSAVTGEFDVSSADGSRVPA